MVHDFPGISIWNFGMGKTGQPFLNSRSFRKISIGKNQNGTFHLHSKPNFRKFCVNGKQPLSPLLSLSVELLSLLRSYSSTWITESSGMETYLLSWACPLSSSLLRSYSSTGITVTSTVMETLSPLLRPSVEFLSLLRSYSSMGITVTSTGMETLNPILRLFPMVLPSFK